jgi:hypothetical protein
MSRIGDELYFAPGIPFAAVDLQFGGLPNQFYQRIVGFYLNPAIKLAQARHDFAAGILAVCAADALGGFITGASGSTERIVGFIRAIPGLEDEGIARLFVDHFRNGLVHEARVKDGGEFSMEVPRVALRRGSSLAVNPRLLADSVHARLSEYRDRLNGNTDELKALKRKIRRRFATELNG